MRRLAVGRQNIRTAYWQSGRWAEGRRYRICGRKLAQIVLRDWRLQHLLIHCRDHPKRLLLWPCEGDCTDKFLRKTMREVAEAIILAKTI